MGGDVRIHSEVTTCAKKTGKPLDYLYLSKEKLGIDRIRKKRKNLRWQLYKDGTERVSIVQIPVIQFHREKETAGPKRIFILKRKPGVKGQGASWS